MSGTDRRAARSAVAMAIQCGELVRQPCSFCGEPEAQAHHEDYDKPLDVIWLCGPHHRQLHADRGDFSAKTAAANGGLRRKQVFFTVDRELLSQFDAAAKREQRSRSNQIVLLMRRLVEGAQP